MADKERNGNDDEMLDMQPEFDIDFRPRLIDHDIIDAGHTLQFDLDKIIVTPEQFDAVWERVAPSIELLDGGAAKAGLQGLKAGVRGRNISLPHINTDFSTGVVMIEPMTGKPLQNVLAERSTDTDEIRGRFAGYSLRFRRNLELPNTYIPQLVYQISMKQVGRQHSYIMPMANGDVGISDLFFEADERIDKRKEILERLFSIVGSHGALANNVNYDLASADFFDSEVLRKVGATADTLVHLFERGDQKTVEDIVCELIENYIDISLRNLVVTRDLMRIPLDATTQPVEYIDDVYESRVSPSSIDFFDWPTQNNDGKSSSQRRCCLVSEDGNTLMVMPLVGVERFE